MMDQRILDRLDRLQHDMKNIFPQGSPFYAVTLNFLEQLRLMANDIADRQKIIIEKLEELSRQR